MLLLPLKLLIYFNNKYITEWITQSKRIHSNAKHKPNQTHYIIKSVSENIKEY